MWQVVADPYEHAPWYKDWLTGLKQGFDALQAPLSVVDMDEAERHPHRCTILSTWRLNVLLSRFRAKSCVVVEHTASNPLSVLARGGYHHLDAPAVKLVITTTPAMARWIARRSPPAVPVVPIGFPYGRPLDGTPQPYLQRDRLAVFPQRIDEEYQPMLAVQLAVALRAAGWRTEFWTPAKPPPRYPVQEWAALGIPVVVAGRRPFLTRLEEARLAIFTPASAGVIVAAYEAYRLGCAPLVPAGGRGMPPWTHDIYRPTYNPLMAYEVLYYANEAANTNLYGQIHVETRWFDPATCVATLLSAWRD